MEAARAILRNLLSNAVKYTDEGEVRHKDQLTRERLVFAIRQISQETR